MPLGVGAHLEKWGVDPDQIIELDWWDSAQTASGDIQLVATPARHFSGRGMRMNNTQWASFVIIGPKHRVYFSGDTGPFPGFAEIGEKYGPFHFTMLKVGAYDENWPDIHLNPEQALAAHVALKGELLMPIHWGTFNLAFHNWFDPPNRLLSAATDPSIRIVIPRPGQMSTCLPRVPVMSKLLITNSRCISARRSSFESTKSITEVLPMTQDKQTSSGGLPAARPVNLKDLVSWQNGSIVSRTLAKRNGGSITLFAFDAGQALSEHTAPFDAIVQILEGEAELVIGGEKVVALAGQTVLMPADIPHAVNAQGRFKMLLLMVREVSA
jgi:quercetin dioxygenase-like cupin family protein